MQIVPATAPPRQSKAGVPTARFGTVRQPGKRRGLRPIQGFAEDGKDQIVFPPPPALTDGYDEMHIRKVCFGYGTSPQRLMRMIRAQSDANQESADEEGLMPWLTWLKGIVNFVIQVMMGYSDYVFEWEQKRDNDIVQQMTADAGYANDGIIKRAEIRENLGVDPVEDGNANKLGIMGPAASSRSTRTSATGGAHERTDRARRAQAAAAGGGGRRRSRVRNPASPASRRQESSEVGVDQPNEEHLLT